MSRRWHGHSRFVDGSHICLIVLHLAVQYINEMQNQTGRMLRLTAESQAANVRHKRNGSKIVSCRNSKQTMSFYLRQAITWSSGTTMQLNQELQADQVGAGMQSHDGADNVDNMQRRRDTERRSKAARPCVLTRKGKGSSRKIVISQIDFSPTHLIRATELPLYWCRAFTFAVDWARGLPEFSLLSSRDQVSMTFTFNPQKILVRNRVVIMTWWTHAFWTTQVKCDGVTLGLGAYYPLDFAFQQQMDPECVSIF